MSKREIEVESERTGGEREVVNKWTGLGALLMARLGWTHSAFDSLTLSSVGILIGNRVALPDSIISFNYRAGDGIRQSDVIHMVKNICVTYFSGKQGRRREHTQHTSVSLSPRGSTAAVTRGDSTDTCGRGQTVVERALPAAGRAGGVGPGSDG